ncbi:hypothetical protein [Alkalihalobacillus sp. AL-G]|uniref:hypothetical protein n=1 Tax=Alkalihalobacillus sp. AL-G TaxID=2926399 RepID=UPI00272D25F0|nr:hypothetical protein [Alkalihalobacillus sp. AL-G]WLD92683.1 hypothetical protein MOJ78_16965 [Alkalihalobacillus sp. AL-G]
MSSFRTTWPYEKMMKDIYIQQCPYCKTENILTSLKEEDLDQAKEGIKTHLIMPCCHSKMTILRADEDYFWTTEQLR